MAAFFIGQRVRVVKVCVALEALGREGRIVGFDPYAFNGFVYYAGYNASVDGIGTTGPDGVRYCFPEENLEPILPSGHRASDFSYQELMDKCREGRGVPA